MGKYFNLRLTSKKSFSLISNGFPLGTPLLAKHMNIPASLMVAFCMDKTDPFVVVSTVAREAGKEYSITKSGIFLWNLGRNWHSNSLIFNYV